MKLEKALSVMEKDTNSQDTEEDDCSPVKKKQSMKTEHHIMNHLMNLMSPTKTTNQMVK